MKRLQRKAVEGDPVSEEPELSDPIEPLEPIKSPQDNQRDMFERQIEDDPSDDNLLVYSDWLEEQGDGYWANGYRDLVKPNAVGRIVDQFADILQGWGWKRAAEEMRDPVIRKEPSHILGSIDNWLAQMFGSDRFGPFVPTRDRVGNVSLQDFKNMIRMYELALIRERGEDEQ